MGEPESERAIVARYSKFPGGQRHAATAQAGLERYASTLAESAGAAAVFVGILNAGRVGFGWRARRVEDRVRMRRMALMFDDSAV